MAVFPERNGNHESLTEGFSSEGTSRICGAGEMASLTRAFDWSRTSVGPVEQWPASLLVTVNTLLESRQPMFLWWGEDLVQFYNDAYRESLRSDKHPAALGQKGKECWPEIWSVVSPQIEQVMQHGLATWSEDQLIPIYRNGKLEDVYWTYGYSPVRDANQDIVGTLVVCAETTTRHLTVENLREERTRLAELFQQAPAFFALLRGPEHVFEMINPLYQELVGTRNLIGKPVREAFPEIKGQGYVERLDEVYQTGTPSIGRGTRINLARGESDALEERYVDFVYQPMRETDGTISGIIALGVDVTEGKQAEKRLLQSEKTSRCWPSGNHHRA